MGLFGSDLARIILHIAFSWCGLLSFDIAEHTKVSGENAAAKTFYLISRIYFTKKSGTQQCNY